MLNTIWKKKRISSDYLYSSCYVLFLKIFRINKIFHIVLIIVHIFIGIENNFKFTLSGTFCFTQRTFENDGAIKFSKNNFNLKCFTLRSYFNDMHVFCTQNHSKFLK